MGYKLTIHFTNGESEEIDEVFETEEDALNEYDTWLDSWGAGMETLQLSGRDYIAADIDGYDIDEV